MQGRLVAVIATIVVLASSERHKRRAGIESDQDASLHSGSGGPAEVTSVLDAAVEEEMASSVRELVGRSHQVTMSLRSVVKSQIEGLVAVMTHKFVGEEATEREAASMTSRASTNDPTEVRKVLEAAVTEEMASSVQELVDRSQEVTEALQAAIKTEVDGLLRGMENKLVGGDAPEEEAASITSRASSDGPTEVKKVLEAAIEEEMAGSIAELVQHSQELTKALQDTVKEQIDGLVADMKHKLVGEESTERNRAASGEGPTEVKKALDAAVEQELASSVKELVDRSQEVTEALQAAVTEDVGEFVERMTIKFVGGEA